MCQEFITKVCGKCKQNLPITEFSQGKKISSACKTCVKEKSRKWYQKNKERRNTKAREWESRNRDAVNAAKRKRRLEYRLANVTAEKPKFDKEKWMQENKSRLAKYRRDWMARSHTASIADRYRRRLNEILANVGVKKQRRAVQFLGCTWLEFAAHIEAQFFNGMTWENRALWHIDHLVPLATAKTEDDVFKLNHYTNLRPLWAKDNIRKGAKLDYHI